MSDPFVAEAATYTTHKKHHGQTYMFSAIFEPSTPVIANSRPPESAATKNNWTKFSNPEDWHSTLFWNFGRNQTQKRSYFKTPATWTWKLQVTKCYNLGTSKNFSADPKCYHSFRQDNQCT